MGRKVSVLCPSHRDINFVALNYVGSTLRQFVFKASREPGARLDIFAAGNSAHESTNVQCS